MTIKLKVGNTNTYQFLKYDHELKPGIIQLYNNYTNLIKYHIMKL